MFFIVYIPRVMSFVKHYFCVRFTPNSWFSVVYPEKLCTLTFWISDNPYSLYHWIAKNHNSLSRFFVSLCTAFLDLLRCVSFFDGLSNGLRSFLLLFFLMLSLLFLIFRKMFTVFTLPLLEGMLSKSFSMIICLLLALVTKRSYSFQVIRFSHQARFYGKFRHYSFVCHFYLCFALH